MFKPFLQFVLLPADDQIVMRSLNRALCRANCPASLPECSGHAQSIIQGAYRQTDVPFAVGATIHARLSVKPVADV